MLDYIEELNEKMSNSAQQYEKDTGKMHDNIIKLQAELREALSSVDYYVF